MRKARPCPPGRGNPEAAANVSTNPRSGRGERAAAGRVRVRRGLLPAARSAAGAVIFTSDDEENFRDLRVNHLAVLLAELIADDGNDDLAPEQFYLTAADDALKLR